MKGLVVTLIILMIFSVAPVIAGAQTDQAGAGNPPVAQPLVREGTVAVKLAEVLGLGTTTDEAYAESMLTAAGIAPRNGWIADYPMTPDIVGELRSGIGDAADARRLNMARDEALKALQDVVYGYSLSVVADNSGSPAEGYLQTTENGPTVVNNYYYDAGPPVVTYYTPPPDYAYLYTWVPYPFWWWNYWFPGFFVLVDFDVHNHHGHFSNHFFDRSSHRFFSVDPARRAHGGTFTGNVRPRTFSGSVVQGGSPASFSGGHSGTVTGGNRQNAPSGRVTNPSPRSSGSVVTPFHRGGALSEPPAGKTMSSYASAPVRSSPSGGIRSFAPSASARSSAAGSGGGRMSSPSAHGSFSPSSAVTGRFSTKRQLIAQQTGVIQRSAISLL